MSGPLLSFDDAGEGGHRPVAGHHPVAEINVTPFVDVMLVLLIVFMVTAPMLAAGVKVDLPKTQGLPPVEQRQEPLIVSVRSDGTVYLGSDAVAPEALAAAVRTRVAARPDLTAHIRADASVPYQRVLDTMSALSQAGAAHIAFIGQPGQAAAGQPGQAPPGGPPAQAGAAPAPAPQPAATSAP